MKLWIDDMRPAPDDSYATIYSVNTAKMVVQLIEDTGIGGDRTIDLIDVDHDAGEFESDGGHYIKFIEWLEETGRNYPIHIHSDNQINLLWMREIIERNGWQEV